MDEPLRSKGGGARTWRWSEDVETETWQCLPGPHFSHLTVIVTLRHWISGILHSKCTDFRAAASVFYTFCCQDLEGFLGMAHSESWTELGLWTGLGGWSKPADCQLGLTISHYKGTCLRDAANTVLSLKKGGGGGGDSCENCEFCQCSKLIQIGLNYLNSNAVFKGRLFAIEMYLVTKWWQTQNMAKWEESLAVSWKTLQSLVNR